MARPRNQRPVIYLTGSEHLDSIVHKTCSALQRCGKDDISFNYSLEAAKILTQFRDEMMELTKKYVDVKQ